MISIAFIALVSYVMVDFKSVKSTAQVRCRHCVLSKAKPGNSFRPTDFTTVLLRFWLKAFILTCDYYSKLF